MFEDILNDKNKTDEEVIEEIGHDTWCVLYCISLLNELVDKGILEGGEFELTERGNKILNLYWEKQGRKPTNEEMKRGMDLIHEMGLLG